LDEKFPDENDLICVSFWDYISWMKSLDVSLSAIIFLDENFLMWSLSGMTFLDEMSGCSGITFLDENVLTWSLCGISLLDENVLMWSLSRMKYLG
jgi:hypothetical protein